MGQGQKLSSPRFQRVSPWVLFRCLIMYVLYSGLGHDNQDVGGGRRRSVCVHVSGEGPWMSTCTTKHAGNTCVYFWILCLVPVLSLSRPFFKGSCVWGHNALPLSDPDSTGHGPSSPWLQSGGKNPGMWPCLLQRRHLMLLRVCIILGCPLIPWALLSGLAAGRRQCRG